MNEQFKLLEEPKVVSSIMVVGALTCFALLPFMCDLKAAQMSEKRRESNQKTFVVWNNNLHLKILKNTLKPPSVGFEIKIKWCLIYKSKPFVKSCFPACCFRTYLQEQLYCCCLGNTNKAT